jgi:hypothetical protein
VHARGSVVLKEFQQSVVADLAQAEERELEEQARPTLAGCFCCVRSPRG